MKLLLFTQVVDERDDVLGFVHGWICELAKHVESVLVVGLSVGSYHFPKNVRVLSLGKDRQASRVRYLWNFFQIIWTQRKAYDAVFVHMTHIYIVLGGLMWRMMGKRVGLWYAHGQAPVTPSVRLAEVLSDVIFTSTPQGFALPSKKLRVIGQGIDTEIFCPREKKADDIFRIVSVGRISEIKDYETLLSAVSIVHEEEKNIEAIIVGGPLTERDRAYQERLLTTVKENNLAGVVHFVGSVSHQDISPYLHQADLLVNCSKTGSLDKAVLEAMAVGTIVLTSNASLSSILRDMHETCVFVEGDGVECARKMMSIITMDKARRHALEERLRGIVVKDHSLSHLMQKIVGALTESPRLPLEENE